MARTLQQLKESVERMIAEQGADAPVAAFIFTNPDVFVMDEDGEQVTQSREIADIISVREQIQEDILSYASLIDDEQIFLNDDVLDALCNIVCDNFTTLLK